MIRNSLEKESQEKEEKEEKLEELENDLYYKVEKTYIEIQGDKGWEKVLEGTSLRKKGFVEMDEKTQQELQKHVLKLGRKLAAKKGRKKKSSKRGQVDLRRSVKEAFKKGGATGRLYYREKIENKPRLLLLCDMSGSVSPYIPFVLSLVGAFLEGFKKDCRFFSL